MIFKDNDIFKKTFDTQINLLIRSATIYFYYSSP